jgi:hypothetical protein
MSPTTTNSKICAGYEPIAGYKLEELIGRGGFGEVWRSEAPGGLHKAVKFVYGATDQHRAVRELRSLERIKGVHHPFLLTLERFGIVDERLVIVTELADGSLEEVYNRHQERGSCGIPRASLLAYLHDAADALDYLHSNYQLQHLDIKPGNLLLVGGHIKVGDFGLLKDLHDADCSVIGGLTPVYAPPELFDGRPSIHSDQYSLAVMYQELLTGTRPFGGRTIAQLATQHVHSAPNLNPLPAADRPVIARALEKDPKRRFASCCEFIDALRSTSSSSARALGGGTDVDSGDTLTGVFRDSRAAPAPAVKDLPQFKVSDVYDGVRTTGHTLVVAIGGVGADILHSLRDRVASHRAACPMDLHSVLIDTDFSTIQAARLAEVSDRIPVCQTIHTGLKSPQEYRSYQGVKYKSISRRWLYNVPRSGATEGMRPLGRLALIDNGEEVVRQLEESIRHLCAVSGNSTPRVYVVGSIDGGTCSGMVLDVIHLIRHVLDKEAMAQIQVMPILVTGPMQRDHKRPLAASDAAATLAEMKYFLSPGNGYPGDIAANWPSVPSARTPLVDTYLIAAGLPGDGTPDPIDTAYEYIWADSTSAGELLAAARQEAAEDESASIEKTSAKIRSVGMIRLRSPKLLEENLLAPSIVRQLLYMWLGDPAEAKELGGDLASKLMRRCGFTLDALVKHCWGRWPAEATARMNKLRETIHGLPVEVRRDVQDFQATLQQIARDTLGTVDESVIAASVNPLKREISARLSDGRCDLALAIDLLKRLEELMQKTASDARSGLLPAHLLPLEGVSGESNDIVHSTDRWLLRVVCCNVAELFEGIANQAIRLRERISDQAGTFARCIQIISQRLSGDDEEVWRFVDEAIRSRVGSVLDTLRSNVSSSVIGLRVMSEESDPMTSESLLQSLLDHALPLIDAALSWADDRATTSVGLEPIAATTTRETSISVTQAQQTASTLIRPAGGGTADGDSLALAATASTTVTQEITPSKPVATETLRWDDPSLIASAIRAVRPTLLECGGCQRLLLIVGSEPERERLEPKIREVHNGPLTTTVVRGAAAMLVCEAQQIRVSDIYSRIVTVAASDHDVMGRLAARNDINWKVTTHPEEH